MHLENDIVVRKKPTKESLKRLYDVCNRIFKDEKCFYTTEQVKQLKKDKVNIFM